MGFRTLPEDKRATGGSRVKTSEVGDATKTNEGLLFEPSSLHKYSTGMREMKLEYFFSENEDEPLVPTNIFANPNPGRGSCHILIYEKNKILSLALSNHKPTLTKPNPN